MKKLLLETNLNKTYVIVMILISLFLLGGYFSYAMFTVNKEKKNAISIVTGNLVYKLEVDGKESNILEIGANSIKEFIVTLSNPNSRKARFNFYYIGNLPDEVNAGYLVEEEVNTLPKEIGINLEKSGTSGSSNTYKIKVNNKSNNSQKITLGVSVGLDYNDLELKDNEHLFEKYYMTVAETLLTNGVGEKGNIDKTDQEQTFITGEDPSNYIWYSGKLWRAVSIDANDNSVKLITKETIAGTTYNINNMLFNNSFIQTWLNDKTIDGFLSNLREPEAFIKMDSKWNATMTTSTNKPAKTTIIENAVGLLNIYEYTMSYKGTTYSKGYLNNGIHFWLLTPSSSNKVWGVSSTGAANQTYDYTTTMGIKPSINLKSSNLVVNGDGTESSPYRLKGDNDKDLQGTLLNTRYSGEYIKLGIGENNLYRIVSHETEKLTKVTSAELLKENNNYKILAFGTNSTYSSSNTMGTFLNNTYLTSSNYFTLDEKQLMEESTTWYLGKVTIGASYRLAKYSNENMSSLTSSRTNATVGLLRFGELMSGQSNNESITYYLITPNTSNHLFVTSKGGGGAFITSTTNEAIKPAFNLKENVIITGGEGTKEKPFEIALSN